MKSAVKEFIAFLTGGALGSVITYAVAKKKIEEREQSIANEKIASMEKYVSFLRDKDEAGNLASCLNYAVKEEDDHNEKEKELEQYQWIKNGGNKKNVVNDPYKDVDYCSFYRSKNNSDLSKDASENNTDPAEAEHPTDDEEEETHQIQKSLDMTARASLRTKPKVIDAREYENPDYDHHDKVTLYYYTGNNMLVDEDDQIVDDPEAYLGDTLNTSGFLTDESISLYVRNVSRGTDYEIGKVFASFED